MKVVIAEAAQQELGDAVTYYDAQGQGLGDSFLEEFQATVARIVEYPDAWQPLSANTRRCRLRRFPYGLIYRADDQAILIVAVAHLHREPNYWLERE
jgi:plasmid stabilization system protein ParE